MKYLLILPIVLICLCTIPPIQLPTSWTGNQQNTTNVNEYTAVVENPDIYLGIQAVPLEIKSERDVQILFYLKNKQTYDLENVNLTFYDHPCFSTGTFLFDLGTVKGNREKQWSSKITSDKLNFDTNCLQRFRISYDANYSFFQDIAILPESEYLQRELQGTLKDVPVKSSSSSSPLSISIKFSEDQPLLEKKLYYMLIDYYNLGNGIFDNTNLVLTSPINIGNMYCTNYTKTGTNTYTLNNLKFIKNKANPTTCNFTASPTPSLDIKSLTLTAGYKYILDNSISIRVKP
jgi:hypothetical protein